MNEIVFLVEEALEGSFTARGFGYSIFTEANTWDELKAAVKDAVYCHFGENEVFVIRTHVAHK